MGVPKFYRWISERYPCLSEVVREYQIPEFDNLYLDMNGIIHNCSHPNDDDVHFRITEEKIFADIFHYIEILFRLIRPRKVFFMAIDGVAPRAKMNQQRGRRFRSAREAIRQEEEAKRKGEALPNEERFDSNCITPGTEFMVKLQEQLKYFVVKKVSSDPIWQGCQIILSGHETPGEGEHKIMEYIRYKKSQPDFSPNTRHCLYGLDADLMMLGLATHEPHFSLLREEVRFGGNASQKRVTTPEETTFHLLHLSLMREYLDYEFSDVKGKIPFGYNLENIIDDWILMGFLVGNDFIPNLPHFHIAKGALPILYRTYMSVLPTLDAQLDGMVNWKREKLKSGVKPPDDSNARGDFSFELLSTVDFSGYINENGKLNMVRFEKFMKKLSEIDLEYFQEVHDNNKFLHSKRSKAKEENPSFKPVPSRSSEVSKFLHEQQKRLNEELGLSDDGESETEESDNGQSIFDMEFVQHKKAYYKEKLDGDASAAYLKDQAESYVRAIQWNLYYYYNGVASWSWYFPHHYAPFVSDITGFADLDLKFDLSQPFLPYQQLLGVLPAASRKLLPQAFQNLMMGVTSPILDFYPTDFETDLNGKQQDWEAVVLIPFIDEKRLITAMAECESYLTDEEKKRNSHGPMYSYVYTPQDLGRYDAPGYFGPVMHSHAKCSTFTREDLAIEPSSILRGLCPGVRLDLYFQGFPTLKHIPHKFYLKEAKVKVFQQPSMGWNMLLEITNQEEVDLKALSEQLVGNTVYVEWPHLIESKVVALADLDTHYSRDPKTSALVVTVMNKDLQSVWGLQESSAREHYFSRFGIKIGNTTVLVYATVVTGRTYTITSEGRVTMEKMVREIKMTGDLTDTFRTTTPRLTDETSLSIDFKFASIFRCMIKWAKETKPYPLQTVVRDLKTADNSPPQFETLEELYPIGSMGFVLAGDYYGAPARVIEHLKEKEAGKLRVNIEMYPNPRFKQPSIEEDYVPGFVVGRELGISGHLVSRITGTIFIVSKENKKYNIGLNLKSNKKNEEVPGWTKKVEKDWCYSYKTQHAVEEMKQKFPELFELISNKVSDDCYKESEVFPGNNSAERLKALTTWVASLPCQKVERQKCGTPYLEQSAVKVIEEIVKATCSKERMKFYKSKVKPKVLYRPSAYQGSALPDHTTVFQLYDRVVNVRDGFCVPQGAHGTVIGIRNFDRNIRDVVLEVVFDQEFVDGMSVRGCSPGKGYLMPSYTLINKSHGDREFTKLSSGQDKTTDSVPAGMKLSVEQTTRATQGGYSSVPPPSILGKDRGDNQRQNQSSKLRGRQDESGSHAQKYLVYGQQSNYRGQANAQPVREVEIKEERPSFAAARSVPPAYVSLQEAAKKLPKPMQFVKGEVLPGNTQKTTDELSRDLQAVLRIGDSASSVKETTPKPPEPQSISFEALAFGSRPPVEAKSNEPSTVSVQTLLNSARGPQRPPPMTSDCLQLMDILSRTGLGAPHYEYMPRGNSVQAILRLRNGLVFQGDVTQTREQAAESAARFALAGFQRSHQGFHPFPPPGVPMGVPMPNHWGHANAPVRIPSPAFGGQPPFLGFSQQPGMPHQYPPGNVHRQRNQRPNSAFVPTQVQRQAVVVRKPEPDEKKEAEAAPLPPPPVAQADVRGVPNQRSQQHQDQQPRRDPRKARIAARFSNK